MTIADPQRATGIVTTKRIFDPKVQERFKTVENAFAA